MDWESFYKWLEGKLWFQLFTIGVVLGAMLLAKAMSGGSSSAKAGSPGRAGRLYATPPEVCYCSKCGSAIDMRKHGLYGRHCREIERCPVCGATGYPLWRKL